MASFTSVVTGNPTNAVDLNQVLNALNGTTSSQIFPTNAPGTPPIVGTLTGTPGSDSDVAQSVVSGDSAGRISSYIRGSDGYGGIRAGAGGSYTATLYAQSGGWVSSAPITIAGASGAVLNLAQYASLSADSVAYRAQVSGDTYPRVEMYIQGSSGYGALAFSNGASNFQTFTQSSTGFTLSTNLRVNGTLTGDSGNMYSNGAGGWVTTGLTANGTNGNSLVSAVYSGSISSDSYGFRTVVAGDTSNRAMLYIRGADGYGGLALSNGGGTYLTLISGSGGFTLSNNLKVNGTLNADSGALYTSGAGGLTLVGISASGAVQASQMSMSYANGAIIDGCHVFSGTGTGTYTHGLNRAPTWAGITENVTGGTTTVGVDSIGSTTLHADVNGSYAFLGWCILN